MKSSIRPAALEQEANLRLGHAIKRAEQALIAKKNHVLRDFGLTVPQYAALLVLSYAPGLSGAQLARECMVTPQTMATILSNLEAKGLVEREPSTVHAKVLVTQLSRAGRALLKRADAQVLMVEQGLAAEFTDAERRQFRDYLERAIVVLTS
jgi:DNA-binding MarR family transcriptional regulator